MTEDNASARKDVSDCNSTLNDVYITQVVVDLTE